MTLSKLQLQNLPELQEQDLLQELDEAELAAVVGGVHVEVQTSKDVLNSSVDFSSGRKVSFGDEVERLGLG